MSSDAVTVCGLEVDQTALELAVEHMAQAGLVSVPDGYRLDLARFAPPADDGDAAPEARAYALLSGNALMGKVFRTMLLQSRASYEASALTPPKQSPASILKEAGFPECVDVLAASERRDNRIARWASVYQGVGSPWLLLKGSERKTLQAVASAALMVWEAKEEGRATGGRTLYVDAYLLCGEADSGNIYGESSRFNILARYRACGLLILGNLGGEKANDRHLETLSSVIVERHKNRLPIVFTTDLSVSDWVGRYRRIDATIAKDMGRRIVEGLAGYVEDPARAKAKAAAHVVELGDRRNHS